MASFPYLLVAVMVLSLANCEEGTTQLPTSTGRKTKLGELLYAGVSPLTTLVIVKFKLVLLALLALIGTAATTKFVAGLFHFLGYHKRHRPYKPLGIKYGRPGYSHFYFDKPYHEEPYYTHYYTENRQSVERNLPRYQIWRWLSSRFKPCTGFFVAEKQMLLPTISTLLSATETN